MTELLCNPVLSKLQEGIQNVSSHLSEQSGTARLWLHYMKCMQTMRLFMLAERTCNWHLHLHCVKDIQLVRLHRTQRVCQRMSLVLAGDDGPAQQPSMAVQHVR